MPRSREPEQNVRTVARLGWLVSDVPEVLPNVRYRVTNGHQLLKLTLQPLTLSGHSRINTAARVRSTLAASNEIFDSGLHDLAITRPVLEYSIEGSTPARMRRNP
jgi:hypothetical protein